MKTNNLTTHKHVCVFKNKCVIWLFGLTYLLSVKHNNKNTLCLSGPDVVKVVAREGDDVILPCYPMSKPSLVNGVFDWQKDGQKEVFFYDDGKHYNNGRTGQDEQFKLWVSHFPDQLQYGNASIVIRNAKVADSGNYTCTFPHVQTFHVQLVIGECWMQPFQTNCLPTTFIQSVHVFKSSPLLSPIMILIRY